MAFARREEAIGRMSNGRAGGFRDASMKKPRKAHDVGGAFARALAFHQGGFLADAQVLYKEILRKRPDHVGALHLLGVSEHQTGHLEAAERFIRRALLVDPRCAAAHYNLGNLLVQWRRLDEALASFGKAIALKADYAEAFCNRGHALGQLKRFEEAMASYDRAIVLKPGFVGAWINRGIALRALHRPEEALASYDRAVALDSGYAEAFNNRGTALHDLKRYDEAVASYDAALSVKPDCADVWSNRGDALAALEQFDGALASHDRALAIDPGLAAAWRGRANALFGSRRYDEAVATYDRALAVAPDHADGWRNRGEALFALERFDAALASYDRALAIDPASAAGWLGRAKALFAARRHDEAVTSYDRALAVAPDRAEVWCNRGEALFALERFDGALASYDRALAIDPNPAARFGRANALFASRRYDQAVASYDEGLSAEPDRADGWCNRGEALFALERFDEALASHERALTINPALPAAWLGRANVLIRTARLGDAFAACDSAVAIAPGSPRALTLLGQCHAGRGDAEQAVACYDRALAIEPDHEYAIAGRIFTLDFDGHAGFAEHQAARARWWQQIGSPIAARPRRLHDNDRDPARRIVLGYVSSDFRKHSAAFGFSPMLKNHDRTHFEVVCYSCSPTEDAVTRYFQSMADRWRRASQWSDDHLAEQIRADKVDILIDLSGHSAGHRLRVFARKPAPIQVSAWGHSTGTGLPTIDYLFSDPVAIPAPVRHLFAEKIYDLPCLIIIEPPLSKPSCSDPPIMSKGHTTYGAFNRIDKVSDDAVGLWARILRSDIGARLLIKHQAIDDPSIRSVLTERFARRGVSAERIDMLGATSRAEHVAAYGQVDVCLDTFPQNGGVSTWEALHAGVPVVAKLGNGVSSRVSGAILSAIGMTEWVAADDDEYAEIALRSASMPDRLRTIRHELPTRIATSSGCDPEAYTRAVEEAYRAMWTDYCGSAASGQENGATGERGSRPARCERHEEA
jgi:predicted O-linked N-acetylglucosamine transferase (SPINDLY family)/predicted TPR repeat methyltransferase